MLPAASRLPASRQHHLGAERDRFIPARSRAGRLLVFFQESHTSRAHRILSSCRPSLTMGIPCSAWPWLKIAPPSCTGVQGTRCSESPSPTAKLCCVFVFVFFFFPPSQTPHCSAAFPSLHLSFPFLGCAAPGSQLCSQGTPQSRAAPLLRGMPHRTHREGINEGLSSPALSTLLHSCWEGPSFSPHLPDLALAVESTDSISPCTAVLISSTESKTKASCDQRGSSCVLGH